LIFQVFPAIFGFAEKAFLFALTAEINGFPII